MPSALDKIAFDAAQAARIGWFFGQKLLASRMGRPVAVPETLRRRPMPDRQRLLADLRSLIAQDWRNIEAGYYTLAADGLGKPLEEIRRALDFFADLSAVERRRHGASKERLLTHTPPGRYPPYYLQKFHFQSDGYLSGASAERYDHQVEVLFGGGAAAMRRQALVPLRGALAGRAIGGPDAARLLDVGCGTGRFLREVKANYPRLYVTGLDLSAHYLAVARRELAPWSRARFIEGAAEAMPFGDAEFDVVTSVYLFHELPPRIRRKVVAEVRRVLRPGGTVIFVDSLQPGDEPAYDATLELFPVAFHEPYYASYLREDLDRLWSPGFTAGERLRAYFSKVLSYRRDPDTC
ncbi:MAG: methyltransferase domain-containing protein [Alphaproteobacteria bacterium]|nr:methyltransferase domain-containing protein [Alphaproteobacteria bacterium]